MHGCQATIFVGGDGDAAYDAVDADVDDSDADADDIA